MWSIPTGQTQLQKNKVAITFCSSQEAERANRKYGQAIKSPRITPSDSCSKAPLLEGFTVLDNIAPVFEHMGTLRIQHTTTMF